MNETPPSAHARPCQSSLEHPFRLWTIDPIALCCFKSSKMYTNPRSNPNSHLTDLGYSRRLRRQASRCFF
ncbi:hypothetical protein M3J09_013815 [Ascochyta lentis]